MAAAAATKDQGKKITCLLRHGYTGFDGDKEINFAYGETKPVSEDKFAQLQADFGDEKPAWFDFKGGKAPELAPEPESTDEEDSEG